MYDGIWFFIGLAVVATVVLYLRRSSGSTASIVHEEDGSAAGERTAYAPRETEKGGVRSALSSVAIATRTISRSVELELDVVRATVDLERTLDSEKALLDGALASAQAKLSWEQRRKQMSSEQRASADRYIAELGAMFKEPDGGTAPVLAYRRPDFSIADTGADQALQSAIRRRIGRLQAERASYLARTAAALECADTRRVFFDEVSRLADAGASESIRNALPPRIASLSPVGPRSSLGGAESSARSRISKDWISNFLTHLERPVPASQSVSIPSMPTGANEVVPVAEEHRALTIQRKALELGIARLIHFTALENLPNILEVGIAPVSNLRSSGIDFLANDGLRLDRHVDAVSVSVTHPNDRMFAKCRWRARERRWAVLVLSPSILWTMPAAFNRHNAADARMAIKPLAQRMSPAAFVDMFSPPEVGTSREDQQLLPDDPTDVQAEVLVFGAISASLIKAVVFHDDAALASHRALCGSRRVEVHAEGTGFFGARSFARRGGWTF